MLKEFVSSYFGLNRQQRNGLFVLLLISGSLLLIRLVYPVFIEPGGIKIRNLPLVKRAQDSLKSDYAYANYKRNDPERKSNLFAFDPNTISYDELIQLGFREKLAKTFLKYRSRGFVFREKQDLRKLYGMSDVFYNKLEPYIRIAAAKPEAAQAAMEKTAAKPAAPSKQAPTVVDLNTADSVTLLGLKGIGPAFAKRILKYRSLLGGFVSVEQLKEVYGFTEEQFQAIRQEITVQPIALKKLNLNTDDFKTINRHPYLGYERTKLIFDWRRKTVLNAVNLKEVLNDEALYRKVLPYLEF